MTVSLSAESCDKVTRHKATTDAFPSEHERTTDLFPGEHEPTVTACDLSGIDTLWSQKIWTTRQGYQSLDSYIQINTTKGANRIEAVSTDNIPQNGPTVVVVVCD